MEELKEKLRRYYYLANLSWPLYINIDSRIKNLALEAIPIPGTNFFFHLLHIPKNCSLEEVESSLEIVFLLAKMGEMVDPCLEDFRWVAGRSISKIEAKRRGKLFSTFALYPAYVLVIDMMEEVFGQEILERWLQERFTSVENLLEGLRDEKSYLISNTLIPLQAHATVNEPETWFSLAGLYMVCKRLGISDPQFEENLEEILTWDKDGLFEKIVSIFSKIPSLNFPHLLKRIEWIIALIFKEVLEESWHPKIINIYYKNVQRHVWSLDD